ncbi:hypothetical protein RI367_001141 [Sorochytrium milnesiophthora]
MLPLRDNAAAAAAANHDAEEAMLLETEVEDDRQPQATMFSCILNVTNTILGSGMLAMPSAISSVGLAFGLILVGFSGLCAAFGLWLLTHAARHVGRTSSFFSLSKLTYPNIAVYFDAAIAIKCFGVATSYLIVIGDLMPEVVAGFGGSTDGILGARRFWITAFMSIVVPLSFAKRLDSLRYTSFVALLAVVYLVGIVVYFFVSPDYPVVPGEVELFRFNTKFFKSLPIFVFAFTCHQNACVLSSSAVVRWTLLTSVHPFGQIFTVYNEIKDNTQRNLNIVLSVCVSTALMVYFIIGSLGYLMFGDQVAGNIIRMYPVIPIVTFGRLALAILFVFSFPIQAHPCRASLNKIINHIQERQSAPAAEGESPASAPTAAAPSPSNRLVPAHDRLLSHAASYQSVEQDDPRALEPGASVPQIGGNASVKPGRLGKSSYASDSFTVDTEDHSRVSSAASLPQPITPPPSALRHIATTAGILILSYTVAFFVRSLDKVLAVVGATGSTTICYILPGLFYYKLYQDQPWSLTRVGAVCLSVTGVCIMVCCLTMQASFA